MAYYSLFLIDINSLDHIRLTPDFGTVLANKCEQAAYIPATNEKRALTPLMVTTKEVGCLIGRFYDADIVKNVSVEPQQLALVAKHDQLHDIKSQTGGHISNLLKQFMKASTYDEQRNLAFGSLVPVYQNPGTQPKDVEFFKTFARESDDPFTAWQIDLQSGLHALLRL